MLKTFILAAGTLLAVTLIANAPAEASTHRSQRFHRGVTTHGAHAARHGRARSHAGIRSHRGRGRTARGALIVHRGHGRHTSRFATARRDQLIQRYVGPRSSYQRVTPSVAGGEQVGAASYYGGGRTASGSRVGGATCAHRFLPFGTRVLVTNLGNARTAVLTVNDRGPFVRGRIVDVSVGAAGMLGMLHSGTARVRVQVVGGPG